MRGPAFPGCETGAETLTQLANALFGHTGQVLLAALFLIACFNTCVGLISCVGQYFHQLFPRLPYVGWAAFFALSSMLLANIGLAGILRLSVPVLNAIYPAAILLIALSFLPARFQQQSIYAWSIGLASVQSVAAALPVAALSRLANTLPLGSIGFGWVLPALAGFGIGLLWAKKLPLDGSFFACRALLEKFADLFLHLLGRSGLGPVEAVVRQLAAHGSGGRIVQHLQIGGDILLHLLAAAEDDVALGRAFFAMAALATTPTSSQRAAVPSRSVLAALTLFS